MSLLFVNPPAGKAPTGGDKKPREPPLGLLYLMALLEEYEIDMELLDLNLERLSVQDFTRKARQFDIVAATCFTNTFPVIYEYMRALHEKNSPPSLIIGGPHATFQAHEILDNDEVFEVVARGEAESYFLQLIQALLEPNPEERLAEFHSIPGISFRTGTGKVLDMPPPPLVDIERLPLPAREQLPPNYAVANILVNRGCPNTCSFCARQKLFGRTRVRSVASILQELGQIRGLPGYEYVNFYDNVNIYPGLLDSLCREITRNRLDISWGAEIRIDKLSHESAQLMRTAGCLGVATGIETANQALLKRHGKTQNIEAVKRGLQNAKDAGLVVQAYFVLGLPGETAGTFQETVSFLESSPLQPGVDIINFFPATPYPGSALWERRDEFEICNLETDFQKYDCNHVLFHTPQLPRDEFEALHARARLIEKAYNLN